jgi:hypothetical protein
MKTDSVWVLTLEITHDRQKLICFLDASKTNGFVANLLEILLPIVAEDNWKEKANLNNRFKATWSFNEPNLIHCGIGHPLLFARKVKNVILEMDENWGETLEYTSLMSSKTSKFIKAENGDMLFQFS